MNIKQKIIFGSMILGFTIINATIVSLSHSLHAHVRVLISILCTVIFVVGRLTGNLEQRWKRDKEMAGIVAEKLMGKPKWEPSSDMSFAAGMTQQQSASNALSGYSTQMANTLGKHTNSLLGGIGGSSGMGKQ